ncbi:MAG TPA: sulfocyanin-like copper-binding protein [Dehalococcoidia bacterium]|nr:sulfocyanin-like copper-binding protein [Dehalococcoidia bacterium]
MKRLLPILACGLLALLLFACADNAEEESQTEGLPVLLDEWKITGASGAPLAPIPAGQTTFAVRNDGGTLHNLVILRTEFTADMLPVEKSKVNEQKAGQVVGRVKDLQAGHATSASFDLEAARYVLICNIPGHYERGMYTTLEVAD